MNFDDSDKQQVSWFFFHGYTVLSPEGLFTVLLEGDKTVYLWK